MSKDKPEIRFAGYTDAWEERKLSDMANVKTGFPFKNENFVDDGQYLVITNGNIQNDSAFVDGKVGNRITAVTDEIKEKYTLNYGDILVTMDGTVGRTAKVVEGNQILAQRVGRLVSESTPEFIYQWLNTGKFFTEMTKVSHGGTIKHISLSEIGDYVAYVPTSKDEREKIGSLFLNIDKTITLHQRKLDLLKEQKKGYLQKMFPKNGAKVPELRFAGFADDWEKRKLGDIMDVTSVKRIHQSDWKTTGVPFYRARDLVSLAKNFPIAEPIFIDKDTYENYSKKSGKVKRNELLVTGVGTLGIAYLVPNDEPLYFKDGNVIWFRNNTLNGNFLYYSFMTTQVQKFIKLSAGTGTVGTYTIESGKKTIISVPIKNEQQKIGDLFQKLDQLITVNQRRVDLLKQEKKALLQKMFV